MMVAYLGEGALVSASAGVGKIVRANRLECALYWLREMAYGLEVLIGAPAIR